MRLPEKPQLPSRSLTAVVIGQAYCEVLEPWLKKLGVEVVSMPANPTVDPRLACHADLSLLHAFGNRLVVSRQIAKNTLMNALRASKAEIELTDAPTAAQYPGDAALCAAIVGEHAFHNAGFSVLAGHARLVHVNQGYAKCAVCPIAANAAITSDPGLAAAMREKGIEVLQIAPGYIDLPGYDTGFIGGSSFMLAPDKLAFTGSLDIHPDRAKILDFLQKHNITPIFLTEKPIFDIGSAIVFE